jgi:PPK2 family polyphosphate:nucleotide phosphotransferase
VPTSGDRQLLRTFSVPLKRVFRLADVPTRDETYFAKDAKPAAREALARDVTALQSLQRKLYAQARSAVLVVLQGMDTAGKDGTIRRVFGPINPQGVAVAPFKKPTAREAAHDFLWRVHQVVPAKGFITVFNRSHYEDILVPKVWRTFPQAEVERRYGQINAFEKYLSENGVLILKFFLHISRAEQKERLQKRLDNPDKRWKFARGDLVTRKKWPQFTSAYESVLNRCNKRWARWYVVPADRKWYRDFLVARIVRLQLEALRLRYPAPADDLSDVVID